MSDDATATIDAPAAPPPTRGKRTKPAGDEPATTNTSAPPQQSPTDATATATAAAGDQPQRRTLDLRSLGSLAADLQVPTPRLQRAAERVDVVPAIRLNGIGYYTELDVELIAAEPGVKRS